MNDFSGSKGLDWDVDTDDRYFTLITKKRDLILREMLRWYTTAT